jgi:hypothetical protein
MKYRTKNYMKNQKTKGSFFQKTPKIDKLYIILTWRQKRSAIIEEEMKIDITTNINESRGSL